MKKIFAVFLAVIIIFNLSFLKLTNKAFAADDSLVGYWKFDEGGSGLVVHDSSGAGNDGAISGPGDITWSSAEVAPISASNPFSLHFDGGGGTGVHVSDSDSLDMVTGITALAWINWDGTGGEDNVVIDKSDHDGGDTPNYRLILKPSGQLALWNGSAAVESSGTVTPDEWTLVNFTINTTSTEFFINGVSAGTGGIGLGAPTSYDLLIGRDAIGRYFHGYIDQVLIYNRVLTADEIANISDGDTPPGDTSGGGGGGGGSIGATVNARYNNLMGQGKTSEAEQLKRDFPAQFPAPVVLAQQTPMPSFTETSCLINSNLKLGSHGEEVKCLQTKLGELIVDGVFGSKTKSAVTLFQENHSPLIQDGVVGPLTRAKLLN